MVDPKDDTGCNQVGLEVWLNLEREKKMGRLSSVVGCGISTKVAMSALVLFVFLLPQDSVGQARFYEGKTITLLYGSSPGGVGELRVRALLPFLRKHIPGEPSIVMEFMPGGGGRKAANYVYGTSRADGFIMWGGPYSVISSAVLGETGVTYDLNKFVYLGSADSANHYTFLSRKQAGMDTPEKLRTALGPRLGAHAVGHSIYLTGRLFAYFLGLNKPKFVTGYSGPELDLALVRGEIDARAITTPSIVRKTPEWFEKEMMDLHAVLEIPKGRHHPHPRFARLPELEEFVRSEKERKLLGLFRSFPHAGVTLYFLPPATPKEPAQILKDAFRKALSDPGFEKEYKKLIGDDATPIMPEDQGKMIREIPRDPEVVDLFKKFAGPEPLPVR